jgi:PAS domain S-box-containing protein
LTPGSTQPVQVASALLDQTKWRVIVAQPRDAFLKPIGKQINSTLWLVSVIGIFVMAVAVVVARQLTQPIIKMTAIAGKIAKGDLTVQVPITSRDELGLLAQSFNDMTGQLRESIGSLQKSEEKYRRLTENARDMIYRMSLPDGHYEYVNPASLNLFGYTPDEFYHSPILIKGLIHPDWTNYFIEQWANLLKGEVPLSYEYQIVHKSGEVKWLYQRNLLISNEDGLPIALEAIVTDITERRKVEDEIRHLNAELEQRVLERTAQLEASNKELEAFSYSVSHDLRAPLRHISGYVDLLNNRFSETLPDKAKHYLNTITASSNQMGTLIDDLLQFSRTGRQEMRQVAMDMNVLVEEVLETLKPDMLNRNISWTVAELPTVLGDYALLKQVWVNLLNNAVKFTRNKDEAKIEVGFTQESDHWAFFVRDNGVGFDTQYAKKLFGVFQRLHSQTDFEGTGIGLANVQRIVHKHAGRVWAEGQLDKGATFNFSIPYSTHS